MSYTYLKNVKPIYDTKKQDFKTTVMRFIRDTCENLRFDKEKEDEEQKNGVFLGKSKKDGDIPYNMQMDIERLCLEAALERFLDTGTAENAFDVYYCYLEMYVGNYSQTKGMIEMLSAYEENGAALLGKHRDHYAHSVYVFSLGIAIYQENVWFRKKYNEFYKLGTDEAAANFLKYWGLAALFHDIGYPFELPYEQIVSYFENDKYERDDIPFIAYREMDKYVCLSQKNQERISKIFGKQKTAFSSIEEVLAFNIFNRLKSSYSLKEQDLLQILRKKPTNPEEFDDYMDHAYFSAVLLFKKLFEEIDDCIDLTLNQEVIDVLSAVAIHNSIFKHSIENNKPLMAQLHPMAWLLMLCDELQCWDRFSYGKNTKNELYPMQVKIDLSGNEIRLKYVFDQEELFKKEMAEARRREIKMLSVLINKEEKSGSTFVKKIGEIVDITEISLLTEVSWSSRNYSSKMQYISSSSFRNLYSFAVALNGRYNYWKEWDTKGTILDKNVFLESKRESMFAEFDSLSLEYKLSNINQAKSFGKYLNEIKCFYTDRAVDYRLLNKFTKKELAVIGSMEHERWLNEHWRMGWEYGNVSDEKRECLRLHKDMISNKKIRGGNISSRCANRHYKRLFQSEKDKDIKPMEMLVALTKLYDGVILYRM